MGKLVPKVAIHPRTCNGTKKGNKNHKCSCADLGEEGARTSAGHGPAQTEDGTADDLAFIEFFRVKFDLLTVDGFDLVFFDEPDGNGAEDYTGADDAVHVEGHQTEHFLNAEPRYDFGLDEGNTKKQAHNGVFKIVPLGVLEVRFVHAHRVE